MEKIIIIGGMAAGCKTAARYKRLNPDSLVTIIEKQEFVSYGACGMPLFAAGEVDAFMDLAKTTWGAVRDAQFFKEVKDIDVLTAHEATHIDTEKQIVAVKNLKTGENLELSYDKLLISTGASASAPPFECEKSDSITTFHNPLDAKNFRQKAQTGQVGSAIIIGGGYIGCELAEAMVSLWGIETTLIERENRLMPNSFDKEMSAFLEKTLAANDILLKLSANVTKVYINQDNTPEVLLNDGTTLSADHVFLCLGVKPNSVLAQNIGIKTNETAAIITDNQLKTNIKNIWAAGDCIAINNLICNKQTFLPLGSLANRQGKVVAESMHGMNTKFPGAVGAASVKVFDRTFASAGLNLFHALKHFPNAKEVMGTWYDRPEYHPEVKSIVAKLVYDGNSKALLGIQLAGNGELTRYVDTFAVYAANNMTLDDLLNAEHAYTPPHSSPMSPLNHLAAMALAQEEQNIVCVNPNDFPKFEGFLLDVRDKSEAEAMPVENALLIELKDLRASMEQIPKDSDILVICQKGTRSYEAANYLKNAGYSVKYLGGGAQFLNSVLE